MSTEATIFETREGNLNDHAVVSRQEWIKRRKELLLKEKELTRARDRIAAERRELPWVRVDEDYVFDGPNGKVRLADLFAGKSQLVVYHFMFGPDWNEGCPSCSYVSDHLDGTLPHLAARDVTVTMISRAPLAKIEAFKKRMGWRFPWVSSYENDFNRDFHVSFAEADKKNGKVDYNYELEEFPSDEAPGLSVFYKNAKGEIFHTYSVYARGLDPLLATYTVLDMVPKGRDEDQLAFTMEWLRHHDRYGTDKFEDADMPYWPETANPSEASSASGSGCGCGSGRARA